MSTPVYALFFKTPGIHAPQRMEGIWSKRVAMQLAAAHRRSGKDVYARRVDIALTRTPK